MGEQSGAGGGEPLDTRAIGQLSEGDRAWLSQLPSYG